jgi:hypothetical protein
MENEDQTTDGPLNFAYNMALMSIDLIALMIYLVYFLGYYAHPKDSAFGGSLFARVMIYIGYFLGYAFLLTIQFDIYFTGRGVNIAVVYYIIQWIQLLYVFILGPSLLVFYESNESLPMVSTLTRVYSIGKTIV